MCVLSRFSHVLFFATPWTVARQAALSVGFSRQKYWSGLPCPPPGELPDLCLTSNLCLMSPALAGGFFTTSATLEAHGLLSTAFFSGKNTGAGSLSLLQGIFPTQGSNPGLLYCRQILYQLNHQGSPFTSLFEANKNSSWDTVEEHLAPRVPDQLVHSQLGHLWFAYTNKLLNLLEL